MPKSKKITPAEWEIMEAVWEMGGAHSVRDVLEHAYPDASKAYTTVQTIMNTLVKKGMLTTQKTGLVNFYTPTNSRQDMVQVEMKTMVSRVFNGSIPALANYLIDSSDLTLEEIERIKSLLKNKEEKLRG